MKKAFTISRAWCLCACQVSVLPFFEHLQKRNGMAGKEGQQRKTEPLYLPDHGFILTVLMSHDERILKLSSTSRGLMHSQDVARK